jgi:addiction module HigA family antidote
MLAQRMKPIHPGEILLDDFLKPMRLSCTRVAEDINLPLLQINEIVQGTRGINAETALRLARYFGNSAQFWFGLQMDYDLGNTYDEKGDHIRKEVKVYQSSD